MENIEIKPDRRTGKRIRALRVEKGLSQRQLSTAHVSYAFISRIERGHRIPSWSALLEIAPGLGVSALFLATGREHDCPFCGR